MTTYSLKNVIRFKLAEAFAEVCGVLASKCNAEALQVSLLELSVPSDRPVPVVFLDYPLQQLITGDFDALFDTAGVGPKKFATLVQILRRAAGLGDINLLSPEVLAGDEGASGVSLQLLEEADLRKRYRDVCDDLLAVGSERLLAQRIDFWVLPSDRQAPRNVLHRQLSELLGCSYDAIAALPGVGRKKIAMLIELLTRALYDAQQSRVSLETSAAPQSPERVNELQGSPAPTWESTDEATWLLWRDTAMRLKLGQEPLGRFARHLGSLARQLWRAPLGRFTRLTMAQLASQGDLTAKQGRDVLEVFADLHAIAERLGDEPSHLSIGIVPRVSGHLNAWAALACQQPQRLTVGEIERELVSPLLAQMQIDLGKRAVRLEEIWRKASAVLQDRSIADAAWPGDGSARETILIDDARAVVEVRWGEGGGWIRRLREQMRAAHLGEREALTLDCACNFFFPNAGVAAGEAPVRPQSLSASREVFPLAAGHRGPRSPDRGAYPGGELRNFLRALDPLSPSRVEAH